MSCALIDLFCGAGGFSTGAKAAGAEPILAVDFWAEALDVHLVNHPNCEHWLEELGKGDTEEEYEAGKADFIRRIKEFVADKCYERLHIHASPPCQNLSALNNVKSVEEGLRLVDWSIQVLDAMYEDPPPGMTFTFSMEQVCHAQMALRGFQRMRFSRVGVPSTRTRAIRLSANVDVEKIPLQKPGTLLGAMQSVGAHEDDIKEGYNRQDNGQRWGGDARHLPLDALSITVTSSAPMLFNPELNKARAMQIPVLAAVQTFPKNYEWGNHSKTLIRRLIGNAVPPMFAESLMRYAVLGQPPPEGTEMYTRYTVNGVHEPDATLSAYPKRVPRRTSRGDGTWRPREEWRTCENCPRKQPCWICLKNHRTAVICYETPGHETEPDARWIIATLRERLGKATERCEACHRNKRGPDFCKYLKHMDQKVYRIIVDELKPEWKAKLEEESQ